MRKLVSLIVGVSMVLCSFAQNFPFPMNEHGYSYPYGITPTTLNNENIQSKFEAWEKALWDEKGEFGRIKYDDKVSTVSEGVAYGMLIYVFMANETNTQCQDHFDKLYAYYKNWANKNGLMNWKITGFSSVAEGGFGGATDADLDVGLALCLAAKQWGSSDKFNYSLEAEQILTSIYSYETFTNNKFQWLKSGDTWNDVGNPCYFTVASIGVYDQAQSSLGFGVKMNWSKIHTDCFEYLRISERNGVWPNWSKWDGTPSWRPWLKDEKTQWDEQQFGWDACRVPWRIAWDYVWFGTQDSKDLASKTLAMLDTKGWTKSPTSVGYFEGLDKEGYENIKIPSSMGYSAGNVAWTGSVACSFMTDADRQESLDKYYDHVSKTYAGPYYAQTLQVLYLLTLSGNAANFYAVNATDEKETLKTVIEKATYVKNSVVVGNGNGEYKQSVVDVLASAISAAEQKYKDSSLTSDQIQTAITDLNSAISTFMKSVNVVADIAELKKYIDMATEILATTSAGTAAGQYSADKRTSLESKLAAANKQYNLETAKQANVDAAAQSLKLAYNSYVDSKVSTAIDDVEFVLNVFPNPCTNILNIVSNETIALVNIVSLSGVKTTVEVEQTSAQIDVSSLATGTYLLQVSFANGTVEKTKFVKK